MDIDWNGGSRKLLGRKDRFLRFAHSVLRTLASYAPSSLAELVSSNLFSELIFSLETSSGEKLFLRNRSSFQKEKWSGRKDSNLRPPGPKPGALPG